MIVLLITHIYTILFLNNQIISKIRLKKWVRWWIRLCNKLINFIVLKVISEWLQRRWLGKEVLRYLWIFFLFLSKLLMINLNLVNSIKKLLLVYSRCMGILALLAKIYFNLLELLIHGFIVLAFLILWLRWQITSKTLETTNHKYGVERVN